MKKIYLLIAGLVIFAGTANAQFTDDMESYTNGPLFSPRWSNWSGDASVTAENIVISNNQFLSGINSGTIGGDNVQDCILVLGNQNAGTWTLAFQMYIPADKTGYFNIQGELSPTNGANGGAGIFNSGNITFNEAGTPGEAVDEANTVDVFIYPEDEWFEVKIVFDIDAATPTYTMTIAGTGGTPVDFQDDAILGGIDFFSINANNEYYVDDVQFVQGLLGTDEFAADVFSAYPNPVVDVLNIRSANAVDSVVIYDVLGKTVLTAQPESISPRIDMSALPSGAYMVNVTINGASKTLKVIK